MLPDFPDDEATVEEICSNRNRRLDPGDPDSRIIRIENGPRDGDSDVIDAWVDELLDAEFADITVVSVKTDRVHVDEEFADWGIQVKYHHPERETYRVPLDPIGEVHVDAESESEALSQASKLFNAGDVVESRDRAELRVSMPELTVPDSVDAVELLTE